MFLRSIAALPPLAPVRSLVTRSILHRGKYVMAIILVHVSQQDVKEILEHKMARVINATGIGKVSLLRH